MNRNFIQKIIICLAFLLFLGGKTVYSQQVFEILVDNSESYTDICTHTGRYLKFLASDNRLIVLDYENYRILFYERGTNFEDNQIIKIIGQLACVQEDQPFNPVNYNRLSWEFTGTIFNNTLWISNYSFGEILQFDLDGII